MNINNKIAIVTGGARGLGRQFALDLAKAGAKVSICDISKKNLHDAEIFFEKEGVSVDSYVADVSLEYDVINFYESVAEKYSGVDISVNNSGVTADSFMVKTDKNGNIVRMPFEKWKKVIDVNLTGVFLCAREAAFQMVKFNKHGVIVSISSISRVGNLGQSNYTASKAGVAAMTVVWAKELAPYKIRSVAIAPGYVDTEMTEFIPETIKLKIKKTIPADRFADKKEISDTLFFIIKNDYVNGRTIEVDGGLRL